MAAKKKSSKKTASTKKSSSSKSSNPKFGSPAWFAKYPKAGKLKNRKKAGKKK